jgi:hypothetical protein
MHLQFVTVSRRPPGRGGPMFCRKGAHFPLWLRRPSYRGAVKGVLYPSCCCAGEDGGQSRGASASQGPSQGHRYCHAPLPRLPDRHASPGGEYLPNRNRALSHVGPAEAVLEYVDWSLHKNLHIHTWHHISAFGHADSMWRNLILCALL